MFNRRYRIRIALNPEQVSSEDSKVINQGASGGGVKPPATGDLLSLPPSTDKDSILIEELHFTGQVQATKKSSNNTTPTTFSIYNLSPPTLAKIKPESVIIVEAGYDTDVGLPLIYAGQIIKVLPDSDLVNNITKIVCSPAFTVNKNVRIAKSYPQGKTYKQILDDLISIAGSYGVPLGKFSTDPQETPKDNPPSTTTTRLNLKPNSFAAEGFLLDEISELCDSIGFRSYIVLGKLYIEPKEYSKTLEVVEITSDQIIGKVRPKKDTSKSLSASTTNKQPVSITVLLDGRINLNKKIRIVDGDYKGYYDIETLTHSMSLEGNDWYTNCDLVGVTANG